MRQNRILYLAAMFAMFAAGVLAQSNSSGGNAHSGKTFFNVDFPNVHSNGRSCATCHVPEEAFQLTPAHVEARFQALQLARQTDPSADDPLFRSVDANDGAEDFTNLRKHALVRIFIPLPTDASGRKLMWPQDDPNATVVSVWRATPTIWNTAFTGPYQLDARFNTLQEQAIGALINHAEITHAPKTKFLNDVAAFQMTQFSSPAVKLLSEALARGQTPGPTDPPLNELEQRGRVIFDHHCINCHGGPTQTVPLPGLPPGIRNIRVSKPVQPFAAEFPFLPSPIPPRNWVFRDGETLTVRPSTDPGQALLTGNIAHLNFFDINTLYGISKTAPYFHDNSAATLEDVLRHYQSDFKAAGKVAPIPPALLLDEEIPPLLAYLKKI